MKSPLPVDGYAGEYCAGPGRLTTSRVRISSALGKKACCTMARWIVRFTR
ncbi:MAG TPA: hypothetical protein VHB50_06875 [Bryobacteraceae bacterium]|nr:hypothetical protein [Bryobacteraceae bacterium]